MRKGVPTEGLDFFKLLYQDDTFCMELGKAVLAAGRLESELIKYLNNKSVEGKAKKASLGKLIFYAKKHNLLEAMVPALETICQQRNYFAHNLHALFSGLVEESILQKSNLLDSDVDTFTEYAFLLKENINGLADIVAKENKNT